MSKPEVCARVAIGSEAACSNFEADERMFPDSTGLQLAHSTPPLPLPSEKRSSCRSVGLRRPMVVWRELISMAPKLALLRGRIAVRFHMPAVNDTFHEL